MVMVVVILMMVILLSITGASLLLSGLNLKTASNLRTGGGAIHVADAGIQHALAIIPQGTNFTYAPNTNTPVLTDVAFPNANSGYKYTVTATNNPSSSSSSSSAILTSTGNGPNSSKRVIKAYIGRSNVSWTPPSAVFIPGSQTSSNLFDDLTTTFFITGNDTNYDNTAGSGAAIPGIAATNSTLFNNIKSAFNTDAKRQRAQGAGYVAGPPTTASIQLSSRTDDVNAMAQNFINQITATTCPPKCTSGLQYTNTNCPSASPCTLGTDAVPQITYISSTSSTVLLGGYTNGSGVLILSAPEVRLLDNFNFHGLIIQLHGPAGTDPELEMTIKGNAKVYGSIMLGPNNSDLEFEIKENAAFRYSSQAISMVNSNWGSCCLAKPVKLIAWNEVMQ